MIGPPHGSHAGRPAALVARGRAPLRRSPVALSAAVAKARAALPTTA